MIMTTLHSVLLRWKSHARHDDFEIPMDGTSPLLSQTAAGRRSRGLNGGDGPCALRNPLMSAMEGLRGMAEPRPGRGT